MTFSRLSLPPVKYYTLVKLICNPLHKAHFIQFISVIALCNKLKKTFKIVQKCFDFHLAYLVKKKTMYVSRQESNAPSRSPHARLCEAIFSQLPSLFWSHICDLCVYLKFVKCFKQFETTTNWLDWITFSRVLNRIFVRD